MNKIFMVGFGITIGGFFWMLISDMWSYFDAYTPPVSDIFYPVMIIVWRVLPPMVMILGIIILLFSTKAKNAVEVDE